LLNEINDILEPQTLNATEPFYEDGIDSFKSALQMRQTVAIKRWQGDRDVTLGKLIFIMFWK